MSRQEKLRYWSNYNKNKTRANRAIKGKEGNISSLRRSEAYIRAWFNLPPKAIIRTNMLPVGVKLKLVNGWYEVDWEATAK